MVWSGVDYLWIIGMISAVWTLILMAPIHCRGSIGEQVMYCNDKYLQICFNAESNTSTSWMTRGWVNCQPIYCTLTVLFISTLLQLNEDISKPFCWLLTIGIRCRRASPVRDPTARLMQNWMHIWNTCVHLENSSTTIPNMAIRQTIMLARVAYPYPGHKGLIQWLYKEFTMSQVCRHSDWFL